ncbi:glycosyltransferase family 2 protein [Magnetospirillum sulfuroxidans]|uniref:Glycosyltransferase family 2 protein n=1 Tax=Magnetospirillum sulfuroxidans TaxID=611300 RepID=A0ABS5IIP5_9PROT|nr:glycosyltransferase family 2 protein [Magnetospirillum sulfuroxidans]MBR9973643.1 glycosyltransferase family 2 protein [Magnetospirillum sulfuroxidans]
MRVGLIIPCYRVARHLGAVLESLPSDLDHILVVDDCCPDGSGQVARQRAAADPRIEVLCHTVNGGVGAAMVTGLRRALELDCDIAIKMDGDGQMDPGFLPALLAPLLAGRAEMAKGNRFRDFKALRAMPPLRLLGNSALSFLVKAASGQWAVMDPTNGYLALSRRAVESIDLERLSPRYFFECDLMIRLGTARLAVEDVAIPARYGDEESSLRIGRVLLTFPPLLARGFLRRLLLSYFVHDFNIASLYLLVGLPLTAFSLLLGLGAWAVSVDSGVPRTAGTVMLAGLPLILGFQLMLQAIAFDVANAPRPKPE